MKTKLPPKIISIYKPIMDQRCVIAAVIKLVFVLAVFCLPIIVIRDYIFIFVALFVSGCWFAVDYFSQPQQIFFLEDRIVLVSIFSRINLFYDNIRSVQPALDSHTKMLKSRMPIFQFWGKRGWFYSKSLENIFIYSLSSKTSDHILIKYSVDYYLLSIQKPEQFINELEIKLIK